MWENLSRKQKILALAVGVAFLVIILYSVVTVFSRMGKVRVNIEVAPFVAEIKLNGEKFENNSTVYLEPGVYDMVAELEHFETLEEEFEITEESEYIYGVMKYSDDEGKAIYDSYTNDYATVEGIIGGVLTDEGEKLRENDPILNYLPYNMKSYTLSYHTKDDGQLLININAKQIYLETAIKQLYSFDDSISVAKYEIKILSEVDTDWKTISFVENSNVDATEFIISGYGSVLDEYEIETMEIGDYIGVKMIKEAPDDWLYQYVYRTILRKDGNSYKMLAAPYPILCVYDVMDVPSDVLDAINKM